VQEVTEPGEKLAKATEIAGRIAEAAPLAVAATLRSSMIALKRGPQAALDDLYPAAARLHATEDASLGIATYLDRQRPVFAGR
jgi:enoyl-CoA hydratase/carnithine racemase